MEQCEYSPPSSKKRPFDTMDINVTIESNAMRQLGYSIIKDAKRGRRVSLVVHPDDNPELVSLARYVTDCRGEQDPEVIRNDVTPEWVHKASMTLPSQRGVVFFRGESIRDGVVCQGVRKFISGSLPRSPVVVAFSSRDAYVNAMEAWPRDLSCNFRQHAIEWPRLRNRRADLDGIIHQLCRQCISRDGSITAILSPEARDTLIRDVLRGAIARVASLRNRIGHGFAVMLRSGDSVITTRHLNGRASSNRPRATASSQPSPQT